MCKCEYAHRLWPQLLYRDPESTCDISGIQTEEGCAITSENAVRGAVLNACADLGGPVVVLEEIPGVCLKHPKNKGMKEWDISEEFFRLESSVFYERGSSVCRVLRKDKSEKKCNLECCHSFDAHNQDDHNGESRYRTCHAR